MAATMATAVGVDRSGRSKSTHRLGSGYAQATAATWRTFARVETYADGSGQFDLVRDGVLLHRFTWGNESTAS